MDVLSDVLDTLKLNSSVYFQHDFAKPWGMEMPPCNVSGFHIVVRGMCYLQMDEIENPVALYGGDIVMLPNGTPHKLMDAPERACLPGPSVRSCIQRGEPVCEGQEVSTTLICGHFEFDRAPAHPLLSNLPDLIHIRKQDRGSNSMLEIVAALLIEESSSKKPGTNRILHRLAELLFISTLRDYLLSVQMKGAYLQALRDPAVHHTLQLIHEHPEQFWTLDSLSRKAGVSRTLLANRFRDLVGTTPISYLTYWRMVKAKEWLANKEIPVAEVAEKVGYNSAAAFNRAFRQQFGTTPGKFRNQVLPLQTETC